MKDKRIEKEKRALKREKAQSLELRDSINEDQFMKTLDLVRNNDLKRGSSYFIVCYRVESFQSVKI